MATLKQRCFDLTDELASTRETIAATEGTGSPLLADLDRVCVTSAVLETDKRLKELQEDGGVPSDGGGFSIVYVNLIGLHDARHIFQKVLSRVTSNEVEGHLHSVFGERFEPDRDQHVLEYVDRAGRLQAGTPGVRAELRRGTLGTGGV